MIPKKIHYFWFSDEPFPKLIQDCIKSWQKVLEGYEFHRWDLSNTPMDCPFAARALRDKKWAFLTDYARMRVIAEHGGIYLDTDVLVLKNFNELLHYDSFWGRADNALVEPVVFGAIPNNAMVCQALKNYQEYPDDKAYQEIPLVLKSGFSTFGFDLEHDLVAEIENNLLLSSEYFCPMPFQRADDNNPLSFATSKTMAIHLWNAAWFDPFRFFWNGRKKAGWIAVWRSVKANPFQGYEFYKNVAYHLKCGIFGYPS